MELCLRFKKLFTTGIVKCFLDRKIVFVCLLAFSRIQASGVAEQGLKKNYKSCVKKRIKVLFNSWEHILNVVQFTTKK